MLLSLSDQMLICVNGSKNSATVAKRKQIEKWIPKPAACGPLTNSRVTKKRKLEIDNRTPCEHLSKRARPPPSPVTKAVMQKARRGTGSGKLRDLSQSRSQSLIDMGSQASASEDQSQLSTPSTITPDFPAFEQELRRRKIFDADTEEMSDEYPSNWEEIQRVLGQERDTPEPTPMEHKGFRRRVVNTGNEAAVMASVSPKLLKDKWNDEPGVAWQHDQPWTKCVPLHPHLTPRLPPPKPDQAIGWTSKAFDEFYAGPLLTLIPTNGRKTSKSFASPSDNLHWPVFTVEGKGAAGQLRKARRQNLHNASVMINNFFELRKRTGSQQLPFGQALVMTMELTAEVAQLNCHWPSRSTNGDMICYGRTLESWSLHSPRLATYREARRSISNIVEWARKTAYAIIVHDLSILEKLSRSSMIQTPPYSQQIPSLVGGLPLSRCSSSTNLSFACEQVQISDSDGQPSTSRRRKKTPSMQENPREKVS